MVTAEQQVTLDVLGVAAGALYLWVAWILHRRPVSAEHAGAMRGFILWWGGLGVIGVAGVAARRLAMGDAGAVVYSVYFAAYVVLLLAMLGGLVYYLLILYTGDRRWFGRVVSFYVLFFLAVVAFIFVQDPFVAPDPETAVMSLQYQEGLPPAHPFSVAITTGLLLPPLLAAGAFLMLLFRVRDPAARYRIMMVAGGLVLWFGHSVLGSAVRMATETAERGFTSSMGGQLLGVLSAVLVLLAYRPPTWVRSWLQRPRPVPQGPSLGDPRRRSMPMVYAWAASALESGD